IAKQFRLPQSASQPAELTAREQATRAAFRVGNSQPMTQKGNGAVTPFPRQPATDDPRSPKSRRTGIGSPPRAPTPRVPSALRRDRTTALEGKGGSGRLD